MDSAITMVSVSILSPHADAACCLVTLMIALVPPNPIPALYCDIPCNFEAE